MSVGTTHALPEHGSSRKYFIAERSIPGLIDSGIWAENVPVLSATTICTCKSPSLRSQTMMKCLEELTQYTSWAVRTNPSTCWRSNRRVKLLDPCVNRVPFFVTENRYNWIPK